jgi:hypothetical protein
MKSRKVTGSDGWQARRLAADQRNRREILDRIERKLDTRSR